jgi:hypothetical protein
MKKKKEEEEEEEESYLLNIACMFLFCIHFFTFSNDSFLGKPGKAEFLESIKLRSSLLAFVFFFFFNKLQNPSLQKRNPKGEYNKAKATEQIQEYRS